MPDYFENERSSIPFRDESGFDEDNEAAKLASMHEGDILNDDGTLYMDMDEIADEDEEAEII